MSGLALETTLNNELLPTEGKPTMPTSANSFNSIVIFLDSPGLPFSAIRGARFTLVL